MSLDDASADLARAYRVFFASPDGMAVVRDLMKFCRFRAEVKSDVDEGMRRVFLHILELSQLTDEQLIELYAGRMMIKPMERQDG